MRNSTWLSFLGGIMWAALCQAPGWAQLNDIAKLQNQVSTNPAPFQNNLAPVSSSLRFLVQQKQRRLMVAAVPSQSQLATVVNRSLGASNDPGAQSAVATANRQNSRCDSGAGARFNLEPVVGSPHIGFAVPQNSESVDFIPEGGVLGADLVIESAVDYRGIFDFFLSPNSPLPNSWGLSQTGYYVHRIRADCSAQFEGGFPHIKAGPFQEIIYSTGEPVLAANPTRNRIYVADLRLGSSVTGIGLLSTTAARLNDPAFCPDGTHLTDSHGSDSLSSLCWPSAVLLDPQSTTFPSTSPDKPYVRADERPSGVGAGDVYVTWTRFDINQGISYIQMAVCPYDFKKTADCSPPQTISGNDPNTQLSELSVRPDGIVTITYVNFTFPLQGLTQVEELDIKYVSCVPHGAPKAPGCSQPSLVLTEKQPLPSGVLLDPARLPFWTYPVHDSRAADDTYEEFITWARCSVDPFFSIGSDVFGSCPVAEVVLTWSSTDSLGNPQRWATPVAVKASRGNQVMPSISTDHASNTINIGYLSTERDPYQHRYQTFQAQVLPGGHNINEPQSTVARLAAEPAADPFYLDFGYLGPEPFGAGTFGGYIGVAARSTSHQSRVYFAFTGQIYQGLFRGQMVSGSNNVLSRVDH